LAGWVKKTTGRRQESPRNDELTYEKQAGTFDLGLRVDRQPNNADSPVDVELQK
jgi:hypothetical protein